MSSGSAGDASIPRRIGAKKATRMHGAVANSTAFCRIHASPAAKLSLSRPSVARARNTSFAVDVDPSAAPRPQIVPKWRRSI